MNSLFRQSGTVDVMKMKSPKVKTTDGFGRKKEKQSPRIKAESRINDRLTVNIEDHTLDDPAMTVNSHVV